MYVYCACNAQKDVMMTQTVIKKASFTFIVGAGEIRQTTDRLHAKRRRK